MHWRDTIQRPLVTEKSNYLADLNNQYTFVVHPKANKIQVKQAIELAWPDVTVEAVNISKMPAKRSRRFRTLAVRKSGWKKAVVKLAAGDSIDLFEGV